MYFQLKGKIIQIFAQVVVIEVNDIGYEVVTPNPYDFEIGGQQLLYTYLYVREDTHMLFGFTTLKQKELFLKLISVKGVGPKVAITMLASTEAEQLLKAIALGDTAYLKKIPGIGPKAASQIVLDLSGKLIDSIDKSTPKKIIQNEEGVAALLALGYSEKEIAKACVNIDPSLEVGTYIKLALKQLL